MNAKLTGDFVEFTVMAFLMVQWTRACEKSRKLVYLYKMRENI